ncbi:hypothetical Protein psc5_06700 [Candidatus Phytoplasma solani]
MTINTDVTITFNANERKATLTAAPNSTKAQGSVVFTNVTVPKKELNTFTKTPTDQAITVTQAESTNPTQATVNKFLQTADTLTVGTDVTITFNANERKATLAVVANSTRAQGDNVVFTNVTVEKQDLSNFTKPTTETITVTQEETTNPTQATVNKFLQTADTLTVGTDVTITFNANERKATLAVVANSTRAQGDNVVFTNVTVEKQDLSTFTKTPTDQAITVTQAESTNPTQATVNKFLQTADTLTVGTDVTITFNANERKATLAVVANSTRAQGDNVVFTNVTVEKQDLSNFTKPTTETITVTQEETTNPTQATVNKFLQTPDTLTLDTDVTITFNANERKATLAVVANSTRAQGDNVVFTNVTVEKQDLSTFTKTPTDQAITVTQAESTNPTQATVNKFLQTADTLTVGTDVTITFNANERKATLAVVANSTRAQGDNVVFTNVTVEKQDLSNFTKPTTETITVTQEETTNPTQATVNKFLQTPDTLTVGTDVTITFNANERKATLAVVANSTRAQGDNVVFTNVTVEKQDLSTFTKPTTETITVTQAESTNPTQATVNKLLQTDGSLNVGTDVTITFNANERKATLASAPDSTKVQGSVVFTNVTVEKQDLSTLTKTTTQAITVTQAESTNPTQATVNKFLQTADTLTVGTDVTITFNANERKATLAVVANSTRAQGDNVVFTNVTVEKQDLSTFTKTPTDQAITVTQAESTNPTQATVNKLLQTADTLTVGTDVTITFNDVDNKKTATITAAPNSTQAQGSVVFTNVKVAQPTAPVVDANATTAPTATTDNRQPNADTNATQQSNGDTNASGQLNAGKTSPADNKIADEKPADDETVKKPTDEAGTKKVADETVKKPADDEKPTDEAGAQKAKEAEAQTAKPVVTAPEAEAQKAKELEAQKTKEAETQKIEGNTETQKIEGNTETKNPAVTEETSKPEENQGNTETKTTVENPVIKETEENTETKTTEGTAKKELNTLTKTPTQAITVTQAEVTTQTQDTLNKFLNEDGKLKVGDVTFTFNANERKATITAKPDSTTLQGSVDFTNVTVENPTQNPVSVQTPPTNNQNTEESSNDSKTILICLTIFLTITLTVLIGLFIHNSKKQK